MNKIRVAVLRGGPSSEYEVSLKTGSVVIKNIPQDIYDIQDILISKEGIWHKNGLTINPHDVISHSDVIFNALHGQYGEDGKVQHILELHGIPFTGSGSFASALGMNKVLTKEVLKRKKIKIPQYRVIGKTEAASKKTLIEIFRAFPLPFVVKPVSAGSSVGVSIVKDFISLETAIKFALEHSDSAIVEEYIPGVEATVGVIDHYRDTERYALPSVEIRPKSGSFFDFDAKYTQGNTLEIVPGNFSVKDKNELEALACQVHEALGLRHYSRIDFIVSPKRGIYVLEANTLPGLTETSTLPKALKAVGAPLSHFLDHIIRLALDGK